MLFSTLLLVMVGGMASFDLSMARSFFIEPLKSSRVRRQAGTDTTNVPVITDMLVHSEVNSRFATVKISSKMRNTYDDSLEATFSVQIPESAFIANFTMVINDTVLIGNVYEKKEAQKKYDDAKEKGQTAGQVKHVDRNIARGMDIFNANVNVAADSDVYFEITYLELLERRLGLYTQRIVVQPMQIVNNLTMVMSYREPQTFSSFIYQEPNTTAERTSSSDSSMFTASSELRNLVYKPSTSLQERMNTETGIDGELVVKYDVDHSLDGGNIITSADNPYFIHYVAVDKSDGLAAIPKNIMFVVDISGSMGGRKIEQAREAIITILPQLEEFDMFNILLFDDTQKMFNPSSLSASAENIQIAQAYARENIIATGGTNINGALIQSVTAVANDMDLSNRVGIIVFLTDGRPTAGETGLNNIRKNIKDSNKGRVALFTLGFGFDVDFEFLKAISWENGGFARRIYEESDAKQQLVDFFREVNVPVLKDVSVVYPSDLVVLEDVTRTIFLNLFSGSEAVIAGKQQGNTGTITATVRGNTATNSIDLEVPESSITQIQGPYGDFTEKLWAYLTIKDLLRKKAIAVTEEEANIHEAKALEMSLNYNFVTPLTSLVIVQEDNSHTDRRESDLTRGMSYPSSGIQMSQNSPNLVYNKPFVCFLILIWLVVPRF